MIEAAGDFLMAEGVSVIRLNQQEQMTDFALSLFQWKRIEDGGLPEFEERYLVRLQDGSYGVYRFGDNGCHVRWSKNPYAVIAYIPYPIPEYEEKENENN